VRRKVAALGVVFLTAHLFFLPPTLEDVDSVNFALGVREFDVANHQPHPPGYPVFVVVARATTAAMNAIGATAPAPQGIALVSVIAGTLLVPMLYALFLRLEPSLAWWATVVTVCSPLFWFNALRPMSDMAGLACATAAQVLLISLFCGVPGRGGGGVDAATGADSPAVRLAAGATLGGLAVGIRSQSLMLIAPLLVAALVWPGAPLTLRQRAMALGVALATPLVWTVPLIVVSGGLAEYLEALGTQGGEDFRGVVMLWTTPHPRVALDALLNSFVWVWGALLPGAVIAGLAAAGALRAGFRAPRMLALLALAFGPYLVFHLLFHETPTLRYALPLVAPVALLALYAMAGLGSAAPAVAGTAIAVVSLAVTLPAGYAYARDGSPAFRIFDAGVATGEAASGASPRVIGMHAVMRRVEEWRRPAHAARVLQAGHGREWLALVEHWRSAPDSSVQFLADPRRTDLALFDPHTRQLTASARWTFPEAPFVAGARPGPADLYTMMPPGWMLDRGWAITAEVGGVTAAGGLGPHVEPSVAWVRARPGESTLILGGRNLDAAGEVIRMTIATASCELDSWEAGPGSFFRRVQLPAGALEGSGYVPLKIAAGSVGDSPRSAAVALEQFDVQSDGMVMMGFLKGWHEPEYQPATARAWRWMSERADIWVRPIGRDVMLTVTGESPRRYFDRAPIVRVLAGEVELARFEPADDFAEEIRLPGAILSASDGIVSLESDLWFSPAERGSADRRHLALRLYGVAVR
jgi:hypothetical protein